MTEKQLQQAIVDAARALGWLCYHTHDSRHSAKGFPDLVMVKGGRLIFAELKAEGKQLSVEQQTWLEAIYLVMDQIAGLLSEFDEETPAIVSFFVWRPADLDRALAILKG